jgi:uncharacterized membrane protein YeiB
MAAYNLQSPRTDWTTMTALQAVPTPTPPLGTRSDRLGVLDVLRGIALLGMFLVHFNDYSSGGGWAGGVYQQIALLFFDERFWTIFGILFGVGFAIQLRRADARGERFVGKYLRRLLALAGFGCIAHGVFGYNVLLGYAIWGVPLLLVRKWSVPVLVAAAILSAASGSIYQVARAEQGVATMGEPAFRAEQAELAAGTQRFKEANTAAQESTSLCYRVRCPPRAHAVVLRPVVDLSPGQHLHPVSAGRAGTPTRPLRPAGAASPADRRADALRRGRLGREHLAAP